MRLHLDLLAAGPWEGVALLLNALLCYPGKAYRGLIGWFQACCTAQEVWAGPLYLQALCHPGV